MKEQISFDKGTVFEGNDSRIVKCMQRALAGDEIRVAFLGGSITQGSLSSTPELCYAYRTFSWWEDNFPKADIKYINAGIGGTTSHLGTGRVQEEVLSHRPDFVIVEFSVNDADEDPHFQETYEGLVRRILAADWKPALMLVHNVRYDDGGNAEKIHRPIGEYYNLPSVAMKPVIYDMVERGILNRRDVTPDDLHPNDYGHELVAGVITCFLDKVREKAVLYGENVDGGDAFLPLKKTVTENAYEDAARMRNDVLQPVKCQGFVKDETEQSCVADCFKKGWMASDKGAVISFEVEGGCIAVQYRKTVRKPAPVAQLVLDGDRENAVKLDANFEETWGDCLYLETVLEHGSRGKHLVEIEIIQADEKDAECFYLVSLITAQK